MYTILSMPSVCKDRRLHLQSHKWLMDSCRHPLVLKYVSYCSSALLKSRKPTTPETLVHRIVLIWAFLLRAVMSFAHLLIMPLHLVTVLSLSWCVVLVDFRLWSALPSLRASAVTLTTATGILLCIVAFSTLLRRSSARALSNVRWGRARVL